MSAHGDGTNTPFCQGGALRLSDSLVSLDGGVCSFVGLPALHHPLLLLLISLLGSFGGQRQEKRCAAESVEWFRVKGS